MNIVDLIADNTNELTDDVFINNEKYKSYTKEIEKLIKENVMLKEMLLSDNSVLNKYINLMNCRSAVMIDIAYLKGFNDFRELLLNKLELKDEN